MSLVHNERTKLTATWFSTMSTAFFAAGAIAPGAALLYGLADFKIGNGSALGIATICAAAGVCLHFAGRAWLRRLRE